MATIRDVAKRAGVSISTVSRTMTGEAFVNHDVQERVWKAVKELNFKPNHAARSLKKGSSKLVGLVLPDITNPFYPQVVQCMESCALKNGYSLILCDAIGDIEKEKNYFEALRNLFVDGILYIASTESVEHVKPFIGEIPLVMVNRYFDVDAPCLNIDNTDAAYKGMRHLLANGHRDIVVMVSDKKRQYNQERMDGVEKALGEFGMKLTDCNIVRGIASEEDAYFTTLKIFSQQKKDLATGVFLFNDYMAFAVYRGIREAGLSIPEDVSVVGFDDIPYVRFLYPPLTTVRHSLNDVADEIFNALLQQMQTKVCAPHSYTKFKSKLIVRESVRDLNDRNDN